MVAHVVGVKRRQIADGEVRAAVAERQKAGRGQRGGRARRLWISSGGGWMRRRRSGPPLGAAPRRPMGRRGGERLRTTRRGFLHACRQRLLLATPATATSTAPRTPARTPAMLRGAAAALATDHAAARRAAAGGACGRAAASPRTCDGVANVVARAVSSSARHGLRRWTRRHAAACSRLLVLAATDAARVRRRRGAACAWSRRSAAWRLAKQRDATARACAEHAAWRELRAATTRSQAAASLRAAWMFLVAAARRRDLEGGLDGFRGASARRMLFAAVPLVHLARRRQRAAIVSLQKAAAAAAQWRLACSAATRTALRRWQAEVVAGRRIAHPPTAALAVRGAWRRWLAVRTRSEVLVLMDSVALHFRLVTWQRHAVASRTLAGSAARTAAVAASAAQRAALVLIGAAAARRRRKMGGRCRRLRCAAACSCGGCERRRRFGWCARRRHGRRRRVLRRRGGSLHPRVADARSSRGRARARGSGGVRSSPLKERCGSDGSPSAPCACGRAARRCRPPRLSRSGCDGRCGGGARAPSTGHSATCWLGSTRAMPRGVASSNGLPAGGTIACRSSATVRSAAGSLGGPSGGAPLSSPSSPAAPRSTPPGARARARSVRGAVARRPTRRAAAAAAGGGARSGSAASAGTRRAGCGTGGGAARRRRRRAPRVHGAVRGAVPLAPPRHAACVRPRLLHLVPSAAAERRRRHVACLRTDRRRRHRRRRSNPVRHAPARVGVGGVAAARGRATDAPLS